MSKFLDKTLIFLKGMANSGSWYDLEVSNKPRHYRLDYIDTATNEDIKKLHQSEIYKDVEAEFKKRGSKFSIDRTGYNIV